MATHHVSTGRHGEKLVVWNTTGKTMRHLPTLTQVLNAGAGEDDGLAVDQAACGAWGGTRIGAWIGAWVRAVIGGVRRTTDIAGVRVCVCVRQRLPRDRERLLTRYRARIGERAVRLYRGAALRGDGACVIDAAFTLQ